MTIMRIDIRPVQRSAGQKATAAAAYRAGERIRDERTGKLHNYSRRQDVTHKEIFLPSSLGGAQVDWARDRGSLWNVAEAAEKRSNSRVAREFQVSLPSELSPPQRLALARGFAREMSDRYSVAVDLALHDPKPGGDPRNFHAHLLITTREITPWGLGDKAGLDMQAVQRAKQGLPDHSEEYTAVRERWAAHMNEAFREANINERVDHRTLAAQGIDRQPMVYVPMEFYRQQIKGLKPGQLERLREDYRARLAARRELARQPAPAKEPIAPLEKAIVQQPALAKEPIATAEKAIDPRNVEEIRKNAVQAWLQMRAKEAESSAGMGTGSSDERERAAEQRLGEQRSLGGQPVENSLAREGDGLQHAERGHDPAGASDAAVERTGVGVGEPAREPERPGAIEGDRSRASDRAGAPSRDHDPDHEQDGASPAPRRHRGYGNDFEM